MRVSRPVQCADHPLTHARCAPGGVAGLCLALLLTACGGGGGSAPIGNTSSTTTATTTTTTTTTSTSLAPEAAYAAKCVSPRSGTDPYTNLAYPDKQGTLLDEQNWLSAWTSDLYLWYSEVPSANPANYSTATAWFDVLKTSAITGSGKPKDRFHFTYDTAIWEGLSQAGVTPSYGIGWDLVSSTPPRQLVVAYLEPNLPAGVSAPPVSRGTQVLSIDGVLLATDDTSSGVATLNAGISPSKVGESHQFVVQDPGSISTRTITLTAAAITETPVQNVQTLAGGSVGYLLFNDHIATAEQALVTAITQLRASNISDLVLDIRYNGGGYLDIASELAYMIAGPASTNGKTFDLVRFNAKHPAVNPVTGAAIAPTGFHATGQGFSVSSGQSLPSLGLSRVFVLTGSGTCSASEAIINGLRGVNVEVIQIGSTTCGKPYGFYPADNCGTTYFSIQFQGQNALAFGNYPDGFVPQTGNTNGIDAQAILPGCSVADDFSHALGDPAEARLAAALAYRNNASCPAATGVVLPSAMHAAAGHLALEIKSPFRTNLILRPR